MMENCKPLISIVMPVYNAEKYLDRCINSIIYQTFKNWELILVDDCSIDKSGRICDFWAKKDSRIRTIHLNRNGGAGNARNQGINKARGSYITFMDADDEIDNLLYENVVESLRENNAEVVVWGVTEEYYNCLDKMISVNVIVPHKKTCRGVSEISEEIINLEKKTLFGYQWNHLYKTSIIKENHIQFEKVYLYEDYFFNIEIVKYINLMNVLPNAFYHYKKRVNDSITTKFVPEYFELSTRRVQTMYDFCLKRKCYNSNVNNILASIYLRYILSALVRNCCPDAKMEHSERMKWINNLYQSELYNSICKKSRIENVMLRILRTLINNRQTILCCILGRVVYIIRRRFTSVFMRIKQVH